MCIDVPYCAILLVGSGLLASNHHLVLCQDPSRNRQFWITLNIPLVVSKCKTDAHQAGSMVLDLVGGFKTRRGEKARGDLFGHDLLGDDWWCDVQQLLVAQLDTFLFLFNFLLEATLVDPIPADNEVNTPFLTSHRELIYIHITH